MKRTLMMCLTAAAAGCAAPIGHEQPDATVATDDGMTTTPTGKVTTVRGSDGTYTTSSTRRR